MRKIYFRSELMIMWNLAATGIGFMIIIIIVLLHLRLYILYCPLDVGKTLFEIRMSVLRLPIFRSTVLVPTSRRRTLVSSSRSGKSRTARRRHSPRKSRRTRSRRDPLARTTPRNLDLGKRKRKKKYVEIFRIREEISRPSPPHQISKVLSSGTSY